jgi:chloride channel protein, CIC family
VGIITARSILAYYSAQRQKEHAYDSPARTRRMLVQGRKLFSHR